MVDSDDDCAVKLEILPPVKNFEASTSNSGCNSNRVGGSVPMTPFNYASGVLETLYLLKILTLSKLLGNLGTKIEEKFRHCAHS